MFWQRGYSNVTLRDIARVVGVDVALISRHFGGKEGLFVQTLTGAFDVLPDPRIMAHFGRDGLIEFVIDIFAAEAHAGVDAPPSVIEMIAMNGHDPEVGNLVTAQQRLHIHQPLAAILGSDARADLFMAVILGCCLSRSANSAVLGDEGASQLRYMLQAAASFGTIARS